MLNSTWDDRDWDEYTSDNNKYKITYSPAGLKISRAKHVVVMARGGEGSGVRSWDPRVLPRRAYWSLVPIPSSDISAGEAKQREAMHLVEGGYGLKMKENSGHDCPAVDNPDWEMISLYHEIADATYERDLCECNNDVTGENFFNEFKNSLG